MSLINQMLQDLDARRAETSGATPYGEQVRAVPERRGTHPIWWLVLALTVVLAGGLAWLLLRPAPPAVVAPAHTAPSRLPLKLDTDMAIGSSPEIAPVRDTSSQPDSIEPTPTRDSGAIARASAPEQQQSASAENVVASLVAPAAKHTEISATAMDAPMHASPSTLQDTAKKADAKKQPTMAPRPNLSDAPSAIESAKHFRELTQQQRAENEYRKAILLLQQGKTTDAVGGLKTALQLDPQHVGARQTLIGVLLEDKRSDDAARSAREGLGLDPSQSGLAMILARLQLEKGELRPAIDTLEHTLPYAADRADYQAFLAALLQRDDKHKQAIEHYLQALQRAPQSGVWWMGLGISLQAEQRFAEAREAFTRAKGTNTLSTELLAFVEARLSQLSR